MKNREQINLVILSEFLVILSEFLVILSEFLVILSEFLVILSKAKDLKISRCFRNNNHLGVVPHFFFCFLFSVFYFSACGGSNSSQPARILPSENTDLLSNTVSVINHTPAQKAKNVATNTPIEVEFSGPIQTAINGFNFHVKDENGAPITGEISFPSANKIAFKPKIQSGPKAIDSVLNISTTYTVTTQFIRDSQGGLIASYEFQFRTTEFVAASGKLTISRLYPEKGPVFQNQSITIEFSESLFPGVPVCSTTRWSESFQMVEVDSMNEENNADLLPAAGTICLKCDGNNCNQLEFQPAAGKWIADYLLLRIRPSSGLTNMSGGQLSGNLNSFKVVIHLPK